MLGAAGGTRLRPATVPSRPRIVASILSKKLTAGSTHVIIDLPYGPQAKLRTRDQAAFVLTSDARLHRLDFDTN